MPCGTCSIVPLLRGGVATGEMLPQFCGSSPRELQVPFQWTGGLFGEAGHAEVRTMFCLMHPTLCRFERLRPLNKPTEPCIGVSQGTGHKPLLLFFFGVVTTHIDHTSHAMHLSCPLLVLGAGGSIFWAPEGEKLLISLCGSPLEAPQPWQLTPNTHRAIHP